MKVIRKEKLVTILKSFSAELIFITAAVGALLIASPAVTEAKYADDITSKEDIVNNKNKGVVLLDRNGKSFFTFYDGKTKEYTPLSAVSEPVQQAVIVAEDENFYQHKGVDFNAVFGAMVANFKKGDIAYGGSTITQQLTKNTLLEPDRNIFRKYEEYILAKKIEAQFSKEEILEMYLNSVYFGEGAYGIGEAAQIYFGKKASELDVSEASMLAGVIAAPSKFSPLSGDFQQAKERQSYVLAEMIEGKYITEDQKQAAEQKELSFNNNRSQETSQAPHFALVVQQQLIKKYGEQKLAMSGMKVQTTLDLTWQAHVEQAVTKQVQKLAGSNGSNAAVVVIDPKTGEVRALVGSANWHNEQFGKVNMAVTPRQPGSAFKPVVYLAGFEKQMLTPASILIDVSRKFENNYKPKNYDEQFRGPVTARYALANSLNVPAVEVMTQIGTDNTLEMAKRLGITTLKTPADYGPSLVLGTGEVPLIELTNAYATLANEGKRHDSVLITSIQDKQGREIYKHQSAARSVVDPKYVFLISSILSDEKIRSDVFGDALDISRTAAVKTGTTENYKDAWTVGYTPSLTVGVWVGNNDNTSMDRVAGSLGAAPIWRDVMEKLSAEMPIENFRPPSGVTARSVCGDNEKKSFKGDGVDTEYFIEGTENKACQPLDGTKLATDEEIKKALSSLAEKKEDEKENEEEEEPQPQPTSPQPDSQQSQLEHIEQSIPRSNFKEDDEDNDSGRGGGNGRGRGRDD